jgi:hypothetical protein
MACKKKLKKYPKKPKVSSSLEVMQKYLERCKEIDKENKQIQAHNKKCEEYRKKVQSHK